MDLVSQCALRVANVVWRPAHGGFAFSVVCKATFDLRPGVSPLAATQEPVAHADVYAGKGGELMVASDLVPAKKRPEVILTGNAHAPQGKPALNVMTRLVVGEIDKSLQISGDRHFDRDGKLSNPKHFIRMPLAWQRASAGPNASNPAGRALGSAAQSDSLGRVPAPNLLPAGLQIQSRDDLVPAVGFGPIAPLWWSRAACLHQHAEGWDPDRWHERTLPAEVELEYFNAAPADQQRSLPFGEDEIYLENLHPRFGQLSTRLAPVMLAATVDLGSGPEPLPMWCDTLIINTDRGRAMLVWRAHVLLDHLDRPGRVVVTSPAAPLASTAPPAVMTSDVEETLVPSGRARATAILPFSSPASVAPSTPLSTRMGAAPQSTLPDAVDSTLAPGFSLRARVLPFVGPLDPLPTPIPAFAPPDPSSQRESISPWAASGARAAGRASEVPPPPSGETPAPPALIGPIAIVSPAAAAVLNSTPPAALDAAEPAVEVSVEAYPPSRCGALAARLACAKGDEERSGEILRAQGLDSEQWQRVHEHWLGRIRDEAARSRKTLLSEYDSGYVQALEAERGAVALDEYAGLAEAAERGEVAGALAEARLPEGAWPHIHRVWIGRMVKDVQTGKLVRWAIDARRAAG